MAEGPRGQLPALPSLGEAVPRDGPGAEEERDDPAVAVGALPGGAPGGLRVQPVLPALSALERRGGAVDAPELHGRAVHVRRLGGGSAGGAQRPDGTAVVLRGLRRDPGRQWTDVGAGEREPAAE